MWWDNLNNYTRSSIKYNNINHIDQSLNMRVIVCLYNVEMWSVRIIVERWFNYKGLVLLFNLIDTETNLAGTPRDFV